MRHDTLGEITRESNTGDWITSIRFGSRKVDLLISPDDQAFETTLRLAEEVVAQLNELDTVAKRVAVADLRETYNSGWNEYEEAQADGSMKTVSDPQLSGAEFEKKLSLNAVNVTGDQVVDFFYDDSGMFWGHSVIVTSLNGIDFSEARAELFG